MEITELLLSMLTSNMDHSNLALPFLPVSDAAPSSRRPKRRKIAVACEECRARKVRCDGKKPACGPCSATVEHYGGEANCVYSGKPSDRSAVPDFGQRIDDERRPLLRQEQSQHPTQTPQDEAQRLPRSLFEERPSASSIDQRASTYNDRTSSVFPHTLSFAPHERPRHNNSAEGVNAMVGEVAADERQPTYGFFGSLSAGGFMRQIRVAVEKEVPYPRTSNSRWSLFDSHGENELPTPSTMSNHALHALPQRRMADRLMEIYWDIVFPLYPFFDREQLNAQYLKIWSGEDDPTSDEDMLMCTFNIIFALGCQLSETIKPENRAATADTFFSRAKALLQFNLWHSGSTALIQCLLLMSQYLQNTDYADQCWMVTGMAIRSAQGLGLHLPETSSRLDSCQGKELARKIWHGCVLMDRVVALTLGRPAMISKEAAGAIPLPTMVDAEYSHSLPELNSPRETEKLSFMAFYAKSLELYEILNDILLSVYKNTNPADRPEDPQNYYFKSFHEGQVTVFQLDYALTAWSQSLPLYLRSQSASSAANHIIKRQSVVLRLRLLYVRMVLLRPILSKYCDLYTRAPLVLSDDSLARRFALQCSIICVKSAQDLIDMIYTNIPPGDSIGRLPAWWYNILYIYTAATVLIAGRLHQAILLELTEEAVGRSWQRALEILQKYQSYGSSAQRCIVALELLYEQVSSSINVGSQCPPVASESLVREVPSGEGISAAVLDMWDLPDFLDMSWLNSVPSNLY